MNEARAPVAPKPRRRWWRLLWRSFAAVALIWLVPVMGGCMNLSTPVDYLMNLGAVERDESLVAPEDGRRHLVVLSHGLWRSAAAMGRLERSLRRHGYETYNENYASTEGFIEDHAAALGRGLEARLAAAGEQEVVLYFVGHSMGGLQIRHYLSTSAAVQPAACVFIATPHRGAQLLDKRKDWLLFQILMGEEAPLQLSPGHPFYQQLRPLKGPVGVIYGGKGDGKGWNDDIDGDDDGTVGVDEAQLPEAQARVRLRLGHTAIGMHPDSVRQVLHFLRHRRFAESPPR